MEVFHVSTEGILLFQNWKLNSATGHFMMAKSGGLYNPVSITFGSILHRAYVSAYVPLGTKTEWSLLELVCQHS